MTDQLHAPEIKGWCPGALAPMMSGDGLVVRVRPRAGALSEQQAFGLAQAAQSHGNGLIDLTSRANLQIRGVTEASYPALLAALGGLALLDADIGREARRNIIMTPFHDAGDSASKFAAELEAALADMPQLPGKFGFAIDTGKQQHLASVSADIRLERAQSGQLAGTLADAFIVRADGMAEGELACADDAIAKMMALASWFLGTGGSASGRMAAHVARGHAPAHANHLPVPSAPSSRPGLCQHGALIGFAFGQMRADALRAIAGLGALRITPWRMVLIEGLRQLPELPDLITSADDPLQSVTACTGQPGCGQANAQTRILARQLAPLVPPGAHLHVSGCSKGCAHPGMAALTLVAGSAGFDLVIRGNAAATPVRRGLSPDWLVANPGTLVGLL